MANAVFVSVVLIRFLLPLLIPKFPLPAILGCLVMDAADQTIFHDPAHPSRLEIHTTC